MEILRATTTAGRAGAYYVRIQAMARKHQIPLDVEFDEHDTPETKYIVAVDNYLPIATCRLYAIDDAKVMLGRIVVLPNTVIKASAHWLSGRQKLGQGNLALRLLLLRVVITRYRSMSQWGMWQTWNER